jgi:hypothetical protein
MKLSTIPTIGGRSTFDYYFENNVLYIRFGISKNAIEAKDSDVKLVKEQVLKYKKEPIQRASFYNKPTWEECPNNRLCPYIAQLVIIGKI